MDDQSQSRSFDETLFTLNYFPDEYCFIITTGIIRKFDTAFGGDYFVLEYGHGGPNTNDARCNDSYFLNGPLAVHQRFFASRKILTVS